jgi:hypothetical protein
MLMSKIKIKKIILIHFKQKALVKSILHYNIKYPLGGAVEERSNFDHINFVLIFIIEYMRSACI